MSTVRIDSPVVDELPAFPPTLREVMLRGRWIAVLLLCLAVAGVFAWLGQWQLARAIQFDPAPAGLTEELRPIAEVTEPGAYLPEPLVGQRVEAEGSWVPGDFLVVSSRYNDGAEGYWVTGQFRLDTATPTSVAVAVGWTSDRAEAFAAADALSSAAERAAEGSAEPGERISLTGRLVSDEGAARPPAAEPGQMDRMSPAMLLSRWHDIDGLDVYRPYLVSEDATGGIADAGLTGIVANPPAELGPVNWLNLFYAAEWVVFAGFAFYLWYRLARDAWEREVEEFEDARGTPDGP